MSNKQSILSKLGSLRLEIEDYYMETEMDLETKIAIGVKMESLRRLIEKL